MCSRSHGWICSNDCQERKTVNAMRCLIYRMVAALALTYWKQGVREARGRCDTELASLDVKFADALGT
jgi:hypothetical protein